MSILTATPPKLRKTQPEPDKDAEFLRELFKAIIAGSPRGGLTYLSTACGAASPSLMRKRLHAKRSFDSITMRAILLAQELRAEPGEELAETTQVGAFTIGWRADDTLGWRYES